MSGRGSTGKAVDLGEDITLDKQKKHTIEIVVDRLVMKPGEALARRLADSVETALKLAGGLVGVLTENGRTFALQREARLHPLRRQLSGNHAAHLFVQQPARRLSGLRRHRLCDDARTLLKMKTSRCWSSVRPVRARRLKPESLSVKIAKQSIAEVTRLSVRAAADFFASLKFTEREMVIAHRILKEIRERLGFLVNVGLDYLTLDRAAATLSGGEGQRIRLATQIGSGLVGVLYILDEPSIGLHQRDNRRLLADTAPAARSGQYGGGGGARCGNDAGGGSYS